MDKNKLYMKLFKLGSYDIGEDVEQYLDEENIPKIEVSKTELCTSALTKEIDISKGPKYIEKEFLKDIPSLKWQVKNVMAYSNLDEYEKGEILDYANRGYIAINKTLRSRNLDPKNEVFNIQKLIEKMPPLDKNIIVYRYTGKSSFPENMNPGDEIELKGYLSTSFWNLLVYGRVCADYEKNHTNFVIMEIHVPKGKKAIFVLGTEDELIFPHLTKLRFLKKDKGVVCFSRGKKDVYINENIDKYVFEML